MDPRTRLNGLLDELALLIGTPGLTLNEDGRCVLQFEGYITLDLFLDEPAGLLWVATLLGELPDGEDEDLLRRMLIANLLGLGTGGATLGLGPDGDVMLHRALPLDEGLDLSALQARLVGFVDAADRWRDELGQPAAPLPQASA